MKLRDIVNVTDKNTKLSVWISMFGTSFSVDNYPDSFKDGECEELLDREVEELFGTNGKICVVLK